MDYDTTMYDNIAEVAGSTTSTVLSIAVYVIAAIAMWRIFSKAGYPGILAIIPVVNVIFLVKVAGYSGWMSLWYLVPFANFIFGIFVALRLGDRFGKSGVFSFFLLWLFSIVGLLVLGFGNATYSRRAR